MSRHRARNRASLLPIAVLAVLAVGVAGLLTIWLSAGGDDGEPVEVDAITHEFAGNHLHGIGFDSARDRLYLATHYGLYFMTPADEGDDGWRLYRLGERTDDFMGFALDPHNPRLMYTSGHPAEGGNLGVLKSADGGETFERVFDGPDGEPVDFHAMALSPAEPGVLYGHYYGDERMYRTRDGGGNWDWFDAEGLPPGGPCWASPCLATEPDDAATVYAGTEEGLYVSTDGGETWEPGNLTSPVAGVGVASGDEPFKLAMVPGEGVIASQDGDNWAPRGDPGIFLENELIFAFAFDPAAHDRVFAATTANRVLESPDRGDTWRIILD